MKTKNYKAGQIVTIKTEKGKENPVNQKGTKRHDELGREIRAGQST